MQRIKANFSENIFITFSTTIEISIKMFIISICSLSCRLKKIPFCLLSSHKYLPFCSIVCSRKKKWRKIFLNVHSTNETSVHFSQIMQIIIIRDECIIFFCWIHLHIISEILHPPSYDLQPVHVFSVFAVQ